MFTPWLCVTLMVMGRQRCEAKQLNTFSYDSDISFSGLFLHELTDLSPWLFPLPSFPSSFISALPPLPPLTVCVFETLEEGRQKCVRPSLYS